MEAIAKAIEARRQRIRDLETENERLREGLKQISKMGRVCPDFDVCEHPACNDSAGAVLIALDALNPQAT